MPNWSLSIAPTCSTLRTPGAEGSALGLVAYFTSHACFSASAPEAPVPTSCPARVALIFFRYVHAHVAVWDLLGRFAQELSFPGVTADLVDDIDRRTLLSCCRERVGHWRPRLQCSFPPVTPQNWSRRGVLVLDHLLDNAMCHVL